MTEIYSGALTGMYTMLWLKMPFLDINTQIFGSIMQCRLSTVPCKSQAMSGTSIV
jgi:hypothetical protein